MNTQQTQPLEAPTDFVAYLFSAAMQHPWFGGQIVQFFGGVPQLEPPPGGEAAAAAAHQFAGRLAAFLETDEFFISLKAAYNGNATT